MTFAVGVKVAVRVKPDPEIPLNVPSLTKTSPMDPSQVNVEPGSSLKVKEMVALSPLFRLFTLLVIANVGEVVSIVTVNPVEATPIFPATSFAFAVRVCVPGDRSVVVIDQFPPVATSEPSIVVPSVSYNVTVEPDSAVPVITGVIMLVI
ncbi:hypothetical protein D3C87_1582900 [compost metagenome]